MRLRSEGAEVIPILHVEILSDFDEPEERRVFMLSGRQWLSVVGCKGRFRCYGAGEHSGGVWWMYKGVVCGVV